MLNPSTADAEINDQTIRTCISIARRTGFGSMEVVNLFAFRATDPRVLKQARNPVGRENDTYILRACRDSDAVLLAWGNDGVLLERNRQVLQLLNDQWVNPARMLCLGKTRLGQPRHPLYTSASTVLQTFESEAAPENGGGVRLSYAGGSPIANS